MQIPALGTWLGPQASCWGFSTPPTAGTFLFPFSCRWRRSAARRAAAVGAGRPVPCAQRGQETGCGVAPARSGGLRWAFCAGTPQDPTPEGFSARWSAARAPAHAVPPAALCAPRLLRWGCAGRNSLPFPTPVQLRFLIHSILRGSAGPLQFCGGG